MMKALLPILFSLTLPTAAQELDLHELVEHHHASSGGVNIHYVALGDGPPVVMIHGFPDYWYTWRDQMAVLAETHTVLALDQRGYNRSDAPEGVAAYAMPNLVADVVAVIADAGFERATIVGHDWGAAVAWQVAMTRPEVVERLVILSVPHPAGFGRELATNDAQKADSQYARDFQEEGAHEQLTAAGLAGWVVEPPARARYVEAFERSSFEGMLAYYKANYPSSSGAAPAAAPVFPRITCPVLVLHGMRDRALHAAGHAGTWDHVDGDVTLVMLQASGHFLQRDEPAKVTRILADWLERTAE